MSHFLGHRSRQILNSLGRENLDFGSDIKPVGKAVVISGHYKAEASGKENICSYSLRLSVKNLQ